MHRHKPYSSNDLAQETLTSDRIEKRRERQRRYYRNMSIDKKKEVITRAQEARAKRKAVIVQIGNSEIDQQCSSSTIPSTSTTSETTQTDRVKRKVDYVNSKIPPQAPMVLRKHQVCKHCNAKRFRHESSTFYCSTGQIQLYSTEIPVKLKELFVSTTEDGNHFRTYVRSYNNSFVFTSFSVKSDKELTKRNKGVYTFKAQGQIYHYINNLLPENDQPN